MINVLFDLRTWAVFDVDSAGRILAGHDESGSLQLVELAPDGSRTQLTALPSRCTGRYVPGSRPRQVIVQHDAGGNELMQLSMITVEAGRPPYTLDELTPLVADGRYMHVLQDVTETSLIYSTNRRNTVDMDVVVRDLGTGEEKVLYDQGGYVGATTVSHDQASVAVTALSLQPASTTVFLAGERSGPVTDADEHAAHHDVAWAADDDSLIISSNHDREFTAVLRVWLDGTTWEELVAADDHDLAVSVSPDASAMVVGHQIDGVYRLAVHDGDGTFRAEVGLPEDGVPSVVWAPDSSRFALLVSAPSDPGSIHSVDARTGEVTTVIDGREQLPVGLALVTPTVHRVPTPDGEQIPCFVYRPAEEAEPDLAGASVLHIHGGPEGQATRMFNPIVQALAGAGLTVIVPNVRGSSGYGKRWVSLDDVDRRLDSVADLAALHAWLPDIGLDPHRSSLWGGSYGGDMVLAGVTMQPDLWAAGVDIVGMSSLVTFLENTSAYRRAYREREYGRLDADRDFLIKASPITYLDQLRAPLFVIHGANDPRVPLSEAEQITAALAERGIRHELKVYADEGHGLAKRVNRKDAYPAAISFLTEVLARP
ncbi:prolyl oligopeptidase family serine peptidase [Microlunatus sp. Gsoil 973]|uniref:S9 family peptidase n=1 Tax=Microlunatus sp. Gsoil 973 TaxID=2672569 RepID=UPI0012B4F76F|nr:prolyl oligopeptidase family serine peptidase [Microlunatus sp. Gsoil 973]QGN34733.1 prolyl oligopeptidase family serine peptidase [Microlunatus sp. Gsoil 973]